MVRARTIKDPAREKRIFFARVLVASFIVILLTGALISRLYYLQILNYEHFQTLSDKNRMQLQSVPPTRGLIYDRNGVLLADNRPVFSLNLVKERVRDMDTTLTRLQQLVSIDEDDIDRFKRESEALDALMSRKVWKSRLTEEEIARLAVNRHELPGVEVDAELVRYYPAGETMSHVLGYVGRINEKELKVLDPVDYAGTNYIGKLGAEKFYEETLHGKVGYQTVETNARGRVLRVLDRTNPVPGRTLTLNLDVRMQQRAIDVMAGRRGAIVAIEPSTGGILALVSTPGFDPNLFVTGIDHKSYSALRDSLDTPLFNRALRGQYPPGSTVKPIVGLAGLEAGAVTPQSYIWDPGWYQLKGDTRFYRDWKRTGHGKVDFHEAIAQSCDTYFYDLAYRMGVDKLAPFMAQFGFGQSTARDIDEDRVGILPSREWKRASRRQAWFPGDSLNMGIGQGFTLTTPLQLATATAMLANRGHWVQPSLLKEAGPGEGEIPARDESVLADIHLKNPENWQHAIDGMEAVMHGRTGTARASGRKSSYHMAGKTGTAQVVAIKQGEKYDASALDERHRDHALFVGFAPVENPRIAVAVLVENGGGGSSAAAPAARAMFDAWLLEFAPDAESEAESTTPENMPSGGH